MASRKTGVTVSGPASRFVTQLKLGVPAGFGGPIGTEDLLRLGAVLRFGKSEVAGGAGEKQDC